MRPRFCCLPVSGILIACVLIASLFGVSRALGAEPETGQVSVKLLIKTVTVDRDADGTARFTGTTQYESRPGWPELPFYPVKVLLPPDAELTSVTVAIADPVVEDVPGEWDVRPAPPVLSADAGVVISAPGVDGRTPDAYGTDAFAPESFLDSLTAGQLCRWKMAEVCVFPYRYNPVRKSLQRLAGGSLVFQFRNLPAAAGLAAVGGPASEAARPRVQEEVLNFDEMAPLYGAPKAAAGAPLLSRYVIITTSNILAVASNEINRLIDSKRDRGWLVSVLTPDCWGGGTSTTAAINIRSYLAAYYDNLNYRYVLIHRGPEMDEPGAHDVVLSASR